MFYQVRYTYHGRNRVVALGEHEKSRRSRSSNAVSCYTVPEKRMSKTQFTDRLPETNTAEGVAAAPVRGAPTPYGRTFESLQYSDFRYFWYGAWLSNVGTWMQNVAQGWLVTQLTGSSFCCL